MKIAFVVPWYGRNIPGGAEALTWQTAHYLQQAGFTVEIITTSIRDLYADWGHNHHQPGIHHEDGLVVRRFAVESRNKHRFDQINWRLMQGQTVSVADEQVFIEQMFNCPDLYTYIRQHQQAYIFIFIPYMFATTYFGAQIAPERTIMVPCLHDEAYARLQIHKQVIPRVKALIFNAESEAKLAAALFPNDGHQIRTVIGTGVETHWSGDGNRFRQKYGLGDAPLLLYVGRRDPGKNIPLLLQYWQQYLTTRETSAKLVLIGPGEIRMRSQDVKQIVDLGFVSTQDKFDAYAAATVFCMPSVHESFSLVLMESWLAGTPVLVHAKGAVTREHCTRSNGGLYFASYTEFRYTLDYLLGHPETAVALGQQGRAYVLQHFQWPTIIDRYRHMITAVETLTKPSATKRKQAAQKQTLLLSH